MEIQIYQLDNGKLPFDSWLKGLKDQRAKTKILVRLDRLSLGNFGDTKSIDEGVSELRINEGKGYRVYFGRKGGEIVFNTVWWQQIHPTKRYKTGKTILEELL